MDQEFAQDFFAEVHKHWVQPELLRRFGQGIPADFKIHRCLIRLVGKQPIVEFNEEFGFVGPAKIIEGASIKEGDAIYLHHIEKVQRVQPFSHDGKRVPFVLLLSQDGLWSMMFDLEPADEPLDSDTPWPFSDRIVEYIENRLAARAAALSPSQLQRLRDAGLWPAPSLLPYPLSRINKLLEDGNPQEAQSLLVRHCTSEFLTQLVAKWKSVEEFARRGRLFQQALDAHMLGEYALSIYSLLPQVEGVMTDWLHGKSGLPQVNFRQESKTGQFFQVITAKAKLTPTGEKVVNGTIDFIINGPVLQGFKKWDDPVSDAFPGRNAMLHGRYEEEQLSQANSIKVFLLLDTVWQMLRL